MLLVAVLFLLALGASNLQLNETTKVITPATSSKIKEPMKRLYKELPRFVELLKAESDKIWPNCHNYTIDPVLLGYDDTCKWFENYQTHTSMMLTLEETEKIFGKFYGHEWFRLLMFVWNYFEDTRRREVPVDPELKEIVVKLIFIICDHKDDVDYRVKMEGTQRDYYEEDVHYSNATIEAKCKRVKRTYMWVHLLY